MIKVIPTAGVLEPMQNYYYYDYKESTELVSSYAKILPQAETLVQLHYTHLMPIITRANDIFIRSLLKTSNIRPDMSDKHIIAICIIRDNENIRFVSRSEIAETFENGLIATDYWTEVIANCPVINEDTGMVPSHLQQAITIRAKQTSATQETINALVAAMDRASESYNIGRIELDKLISTSLANGGMQSRISDKFHILTSQEDTNTIQWDNVINSQDLLAKQLSVKQLKHQYDSAVNQLRIECEIRNNLQRFANGQLFGQVEQKLRPTQITDDSAQQVLCFIGKYIEKCTILEPKQIGVYNPEYLKFMSCLLEKGFHILPMNIEVTITKNIFNLPYTGCQHSVIEHQEYSYRSRIARVAAILNADSIQYSCAPVETETQNSDSKVSQLTSKYITTALLIW